MSAYGEIMFPFYKRATAIGIVNFIARLVTALSSLAAELDRPWPVLLLIGSTAIALVTAFFLPSAAEEEEFEKALEAANSRPFSKKGDAESNKDD